MRSFTLTLCIALNLLQTAPGPDGGRIDSMDALSFVAPKEKARVEVVPGRVGNALRFSFDADCQGKFVAGRAPAPPEWDGAAGFSFWVKGDGSGHLGGIEFIWNGDYATRYAFAFPIDGTEWRKIEVPWRDLVPELGKTTDSVDPKHGLAPSKLGPIQFGKWWYWRDYAAHSYAIDDIRLEPALTVDTRDYRPASDPLARVRAKLKRSQPITVVTMGDSLTDTSHWTNREHNWPQLLKSRLKQRFGAEAALVNPAMGGTELRHNVIVMPRWTSTTPAPDLVTIFFGFNDWGSGMRGPAFQAALQDAVARVRRATGGRADVLILTTCPSLEKPEMLSEMAAACREAARASNAGLADVFSAFQATPTADQPSLYATDKVHLSLAGQELVANTALDCLSTGATSPSRPRTR